MRMRVGLGLLCLVLFMLVGSRGFAYDDLCTPVGTPVIYMVPTTDVLNQWAIPTGQMDGLCPVDDYVFDKSSRVLDDYDLQGNGPPLCDSLSYTHIHSGAVGFDAYTELIAPNTPFKFGRYVITNVGGFSGGMQAHDMCLNLYSTNTCYGTGAITASCINHVLALGSSQVKVLLTLRMIAHRTDTGAFIPGAAAKIGVALKVNGVVSSTVIIDVTEGTEGYWRTFEFTSETYDNLMDGVDCMGLDCWQAPIELHVYGFPKKATGGSAPPLSLQNVRVQVAAAIIAVDTFAHGCLNAAGACSLADF